MQGNTIGDIRIRASSEQKKNLQTLAELGGYRSLSDYCRSKLFEEYSIHQKLNKIISIVNSKDPVQSGAQETEGKQVS